MITEKKWTKEEIKKYLKSMNKREYDMFIDYLVPTCDYSAIRFFRNEEYRKTPWEALEAAVDLLKTELETEGWGVKKSLEVGVNSLENEYKIEEPREKKTRVYIGKTRLGNWYTLVDNEEAQFTGPSASMEDAARCFDYHHQGDRDSFDLWSYGADIRDLADIIHYGSVENV